MDFNKVCETFIMYLNKNLWIVIDFFMTNLLIGIAIFKFLLFEMITMTMVVWLYEVVAATIVVEVPHGDCWQDDNNDGGVIGGGGNSNSDYGGGMELGWWWSRGGVVVIMVVELVVM